MGLGAQYIWQWWWWKLWPGVSGGWWKKHQDHWSEIFIMVANRMTKMMICEFILLIICSPLFFPENACSRCFRVAHLDREDQCTVEMVWWRDRLGAFKTHQTIMAQVTSYLNDYKPMQVRRTKKSDRTWYDVKSGTIPKSRYIVCSRYSGGLIDLWIMLFSLLWPGGMQMKVAKEPLKQLQKLLYILGPADAFVSQVQTTCDCPTQVLDHGQRRRLRRARKPGNQWPLLLVAWKGAKIYSLCSGFFRKKSCPGCVRKVYAGWTALWDSKN